MKTAAKLAAYIAERDLPRDAVPMVAKDARYRQPLQDILDLMHDLRAHAGPISEKVEKVNLAYFPFLKEKYDNYPKRMRDLDQLADLTVPYRSLNRFLNDMALEPPDEDGTGVGSKADSLVLSTIHSAKGLEWHTVILIWAAEGRIPSPRSMDSEMDLEEERRLLYVAATRAKRNLVIIAPQTMLDRRIGQVDVKLSRFFEEVPSEYFRYYAG
jgi:DNA helicase-2/ATP-dependent DNA helicase PcrA